LYEDIMMLCHTWTNLLYVLCPSCYVKHNTDNKNWKDRPCVYKVKMRRVRAISVAGKAVGITYSESVFVALGTQYTMRMHRIVICDLLD